MKQAGERITMLTAYDASFARLLDQDQIDYHCAAVSRGASRAHLVGDMPFGSYQASADEAVKNAMRLVAEGGMEAVKLEGGADYCDVIARIVRAGIPVMGHIGLTPQSVHKMGGYVVQGRGEDKAARMIADARALEKAGCYSLILEAIPAELGAEITRSVGIPTIGIGAGLECDGQVLVVYDLLGMNPEFSPKFVKKYANLAEVIGEAAARYRDEVRAGAFPADEHTFSAEKPAAKPAPQSQAKAAVPIHLAIPSNGEERPLKLYSV